TDGEHQQRSSREHRSQTRHERLRIGLSRSTPTVDLRSPTSQSAGRRPNDKGRWGTSSGQAEIPLSRR
ncbi:hypothetical protein Ancab_029736, partial [Ancistrocladus abbreviatus]